MILSIAILYPAKSYWMPDALATNDRQKSEYHEYFMVNLALKVTSDKYLSFVSFLLFMNEILRKSSEYIFICETGYALTRIIVSIVTPGLFNKINWSVRCFGYIVYYVHL